LESRLDLCGHGDAEGIGHLDAAQLADVLQGAGLKQLGVLKIEACNVGKGNYLNELKAELTKRGIDVGYISAPTDYFSENRTYEVKDGAERVKTELPILPKKMVGAFKPAALGGMKIVKGNVDIGFPGTRYNLPPASR